MSAPALSDWTVVGARRPAHAAVAAAAPAPRELSRWITALADRGVVRMEARSRARASAAPSFDKRAILQNAQDLTASALRELAAAPPGSVLWALVALTTQNRAADADGRTRADASALARARRPAPHPRSSIR